MKWYYIWIMYNHAIYYQESNTSLGHVVGWCEFISIMCVWAQSGGQVTHPFATQWLSCCSYLCPLLSSVICHPLLSWESEMESCWWSFSANKALGVLMGSKWVLIVSPAVSPGSNDGQWQPRLCEQGQRYRLRWVLAPLYSEHVRPHLHYKIWEPINMGKLINWGSSVENLEMVKHGAPTLWGWGS